MQNININTWRLPREVKGLLDNCVKYLIPQSRDELLSLAMGGEGTDLFEVAYDVPGQGRIKEATVARCKNGAAVNYTTEYMRRRDPDCMVVADEGPTDKPRYRDRFGTSFNSLRTETFEWFKKQSLIVMPFTPGQETTGYYGLLIAPDNAGFFAAGLGDLQGMIPVQEVPHNFTPRTIVYLAPPFRHTHFEGKQVVVHNRLENMHEIFSYNLYPGPSAKKGIYGLLLNIGEKEGWLTLHGSTIQLITPYDNVATIMHEGASGGGKSEMIEYVHRLEDGRLLLGRNIVTGEQRRLTLTQACALHPVTDDMALCHPSLQENQRKLVITDAEEAWFLRVNHIDHYGTEPYLEELCVHPNEPLIFLNIDGVPGGTCLLWEHTQDKPGQPCPNPRVIMPRRLVPNIVNEPVTVDIRSFGVRTPPCTRERPTYGIVGYLHVLPPALAWIWRLVAPRGHENPSIVETMGMTSEGVGSYWPFATGRRVEQANLLLRQIKDTPDTRYTLSPNQHVGAWWVSFMPQWIAREYLARRGIAWFRPEQLIPARCALLGYVLRSMQIEGTIIPQWFLEVNKQPEVGDNGYDAGAKILYDFFRRELPQFLEPDLDPLGKEIITCCMDGGTIEDYEKFIPA
ncbi:DUF4914 family protein [bacterium]|nr:DUF4914 family protein [bacterium]MBU4539573.1 DUF4914 family protein [Bacteroidota bacterium]MCG2676764.1 DUF4914 family protein [bacterium]MCG2677170.1 DUF4914 family protein [bacterium]